MNPHDTDAQPPPSPRSHSSARTSLSLLQRARTGEPEAWRRLFELYRPLVFHWCRRWNVDDADVDDVTQEVFQTATVRLESFRRERPGDSFRGWLCGITRHKILAYRERQQRQPRAAGGTTVLRQLQDLPGEDELPLGGGPEADADDVDAVAALFRRAVAMVQCEFEPATWTAFWRTVVDAVPTRDVAAELNTTPAAVRMAKSRVLRRLRQESGDLLDE